MRYLDSTREVEIRELCPVNDSVLKLSYVVNDWETKGHFFKHNIIAGGFCFYRFNDVSIFQWHPFSTFSSKNGMNENAQYTLNVKDIIPMHCGV